MKDRRGTSPKPAAPHITISVSGKLLEGHLPYLEQLVHSATECRLWPVLKLERLEEMDRAAVLYLIGGENQEFAIACCPNFVREWMEHERDGTAAA